MKKTILIGLIFTAVFFGCEDDCDCGSGPLYAELKVKLSINDENPELLLTIVEGKIETGDTIVSEYVSERNMYYEMEADRYYSASVTYEDGGRQITAIDGKKMRTSEDDCGCEYAENSTLNLRLAL